MKRIQSSVENELRGERPSGVSNPDMCREATGVCNGTPLRRNMEWHASKEAQRTWESPSVRAVVTPSGSYKASLEMEATDNGKSDEPIILMRGKTT